MGMTQERIKECIKLLETDGINSKAMVLDILKKELASSLLVQETKIEPKEFWRRAYLTHFNGKELYEMTSDVEKYIRHEFANSFRDEIEEIIPIHATPLHLKMEFSQDQPGVAFECRFEYYIEKRGIVINNETN